MSTHTFRPYPGILNLMFLQFIPILAALGYLPEPSFMSKELFIVIFIMLTALTFFRMITYLFTKLTIDGERIILTRFGKRQWELSTNKVFVNFEKMLLSADGIVRPIQLSLWEWKIFFNGNPLDPNKFESIFSLSILNALHENGVTIVPLSSNI